MGFIFLERELRKGCQAQVELPRPLPLAPRVNHPLASPVTISILPSLEFPPPPAAKALPGPGVTQHCCTGAGLTSSPPKYPCIRKGALFNPFLPLCFTACLVVGFWWWGFFFLIICCLRVIIYFLEAHVPEL